MELIIHISNAEKFFGTIVEFRNFYRTNWNAFYDVEKYRPKETFNLLSKRRVSTTGVAKGIIVW